MLPVGAQTHPNAIIPRVTLIIIGVNLLVFLAQVVIGEPLDYGFSLVPKEITHGKDLVKPEKIRVKAPEMAYDDEDDDEDAPPEKSPSKNAPRVVHTAHGREIEIKVPQHPGPVPIYLTLFTSMFMHTGVIHLLGNMWFLYLFGRNVEYALKPGLFLAFYLICGVAAGMAHVLSGPESVIPCMGASGAISGVLGAYFFVFPLNKVKIWVGLRYTIDVPACGALICWLVLQYASSIATSDTEVGGVAYWAHLGGFAAGLCFVGVLFLTLWLRKKPVAEAEAAEEGAEENAVPADATEEVTAVKPKTAAAIVDPFAAALAPPAPTALTTAKYLQQPPDDPFRAAVPEVRRARREV